VPSWKHVLSDNQISDVVSYLKRNQTNKTHTSVTLMHTYYRQALTRLYSLFISAPCLLLMLALVPASPSYSETNGKPGVDVEALTLEAVDLISRLQRLEQQLLYPAHTHVSVFLSVAENSQARLHSASLEIDDDRVNDHIYTLKETSALNAGGIQRLYTGNVLMGNHRLRVSLRLVQEDGSVRTHELEYKFTKDESAENIEIIFDDVKPHILVQSRG